MQGMLARGDLKMRQSRRERKQTETRRRASLRRFFFSGVGLIALTLGMVWASFGEPGHWDWPPRFSPPLPPLEGGTEEETRPDVVPTVPGIIRSGPLHQRRVAITFDDGPDVNSTPQILAVLREYGVVATFFLVGNRAELYPDLVRSIARDGHELANHTWSHPRMELLSEQRAVGELVTTTQLLTRLGHQPIRWFRPPYGSFSEEVLQWVQRAGLITVLWSVDSRDWDGRSAESIFRRVVSQVQPGSIILLHCAAGASEAPYQTLRALPDIITFLREAGYEMVTLGQLLDEG